MLTRLAGAVLVAAKRRLYTLESKKGKSSTFDEMNYGIWKTDVDGECPHGNADDCDACPDPGSDATGCYKAFHTKCQTMQAFSILGVLSAAAAAGLAAAGGLGVMDVKMTGMAGAGAAGFGGECSPPAVRRPSAPPSPHPLRRRFPLGLPPPHGRVWTAAACSVIVPCVSTVRAQLARLALAMATRHIHQPATSPSVGTFFVCVSPAHVRSALLPHHLRNRCGFVQRRSKGQQRRFGLRPWGSRRRRLQLRVRAPPPLTPARARARGKPPVRV